MKNLQKHKVRLKNKVR